MQGHTAHPMRRFPSPLMILDGPGFPFAFTAPLAPTLRNAILLALGLTPLFTALVFVALSLPPSHDEHQYLAAAYFWDDLTIYKDYFYSQTPYFPQALDAWMAWVGHAFESPYLAARIFNLFWSMVFVGLLAVALLHVSPAPMLAYGLLCAVFASQSLDLPFRLVRNDTMPLAWATLALLSVIMAQRIRTTWTVMALHFVAGLALAIAVGTKQSYAFIAMAFVLYALIAPHLPTKSRLVRMVLPLMVGGLLGGLPMAVVMLPHWENASYAIGQFHVESHALAHWGALELALLDRVTSVASVLLDPPSIILMAAIGFALVYLYRGVSYRRIVRERPVEFSLLILCILSVSATLLGCLMTRPFHFQYAAPMMPFLAVGIAAFSRLMHDQVPSRHSTTSVVTQNVVGAAMVTVSIVLSLTVVTWGVPYHLKQMALADQTQTQLNNRRAGEAGQVFVAPHFERVRRDIQGILGAPDQDLRIATMMPTYVLDAGFGIYPELASAPFFYWSNDYLDDDQLDALKGTSPRRTHTWLAEKNAQVILTGYHKDFSEPLATYAEEQGFRCYRIDLTGGYRKNEAQLHLAPDLAEGLQAGPATC